MADEKLKTVYVRLTKDFPIGVPHRRGGVVLAAGPAPVQAEVTKDQLEALNADPKVQIVDREEFDKWQDRLAEEPEHPTSTDLIGGEGSDEDGEGGRDYGDGDDDDEDEGTEDDESDDLDSVDKLADLKEIAATEEVDVTGLSSKVEVRDAIRAKRAAAADEE